jgi:tetratricopeptide (TPR) repeat protein
MDEILHAEEEAPPVTSRLRTAKYLTFALPLSIILAFAVAVALFRTGRPGPESPPSSDNPTLAILPFANNTGDESLDFWENGLAGLLVSDLSQSRYLNVLSQDRVFVVLRDLGQLDAEDGSAIDLTEVAARAKVENIVVGNFIKAGQRFRINATVRHIPTGGSVVLPSVEARNEEEILFRIDDLSTKIKNHMVRPGNRTGRDIDLDTGSITTSSIEAYRHYIDGRSSYFKGSRIDAMESLEMAVAIDPEFAMAHNYLAMCYRSFPGHEDKAEEAMSRAFELSHHASPRERFFIQAIYYRTQGQRGRGQYLETCQEFVKVYPDDPRANMALGEIYLSLEDWDRCIETLESINDVDFPGPLFDNLRRAYGALGKYDEALACVKAAPAGTDSLQYRHQLALNLIYEGSFEAALREADAMLERSPGYVYALMVKGDVHFFRAEWDQAEVYYKDLLKPVSRESSRLWFRCKGLHRLVNLYLARGQFEQAQNVVSQAIDEVTTVGEKKWLLSFRYRMATILRAQGDLSGAHAGIQSALEDAERRGHVTGKITALGIHGLILLEMGNVGGAERAAVEMKAEIEGWLNPKLMRDWYHLAGHIALARNDVGQAVDHFERAVSLLPYQFEVNGDHWHAIYYSSLANAYYLSGDLAGAQEWYENILSLTTGRLLWGNIFAESHFMLGKIYQQRGMNAEAIRSYRSFLDLWREADVVTPELEEAKRSLEALLD